MAPVELISGGKAHNAATYYCNVEFLLHKIAAKVRNKPRDCTKLGGETQGVKKLILMKIICIGRNYAAHAKEMKAPVPREPVFFMKPDTALLRGRDLYHPAFTTDLHHEIELVLKISKPGKHIEEQFAHNYYNEISVGIDFTARDIQEKCKAGGLPWEKAKSFDNSAAVGSFVPRAKLNEADIGFSLKVNDELRQEGNSSSMIFSFSSIISYVSQFVSLKTGDLIFTGTPEGVAAVKPGDELQGFLGNNVCLQLRIR
jgi:acylpyruvate hydrolase